MRAENNRALLMFALLLMPMFLVFAPLEAEATSARVGTPDLEVVSVTISSGGSIDSGSGIVLAPGSHIVSVVVRNLGTAAAGGTVVLTNGSTAAPNDLIDSIILSAVQPGESSSALLFNWNAQKGVSQRLKATVNAEGDPNSLNDQGTLDFSVSDFQRGEVSSHDTPEPLPGDPDVRFSESSLSILSSVRNIGVIPLLATMRVTLTNASDGSQSFVFHSVGISLNPGTLTSISQSSGIQIDVDVSGFDGDWIMDVDALFNGTGSDDVVSVVATGAITFSPYNALLSAPTDRSTQPGVTTQLTFVIRNIGNAADSFTIGLTSSSGWADTSQDGDTTLVVNSNGMLSVVVSVSVPEDASRSAVEQVDLLLTSTEAAYTLSASAKVMAGDFYRAALEAPHMDATGVVWLDGTGGIGGIVITSPGTNYFDSFEVEVAPTVFFNGGDGSGAVATAVMAGDGSVASVTIDDAGTGYTLAPDVIFNPGAAAVHHTPIIPGYSAQVSFSVHNTGNVPSSFNLESGFSSTANGWEVGLSATETDIIPVGESRMVSALVTSPSLQNPLDPSSRLRDGETLELWLEASPAGGVSTTVTEQLSVQPTIIVDPGLELIHIELTEEQVIAALGSTGVEQFIDMEVEVVHNLVNGPNDAVGVAISVGAITFSPLSSGGSLEATRWDASTSINSTTLALGETESASLGILGPSDMLPLAGTLSIPIIASPTISVAQAAANVNAASVTRTVTIDIPRITSAELEDVNELKLVPGNESVFDLNITNTGNDISSYLISLQSGYPAEWDVGIGSGATSLQISDVKPKMFTHPTITGDETASFEVNVTIPSNSPAGVSNSITLVVMDVTTGNLLTTSEIFFITEEKVSANLSVEEIKLDVALADAPPFARVYIENTGNVLTSYGLWLDISESGDVAFFIDGSDEITIGAGYSASVKIRVTPASDASSDYHHYARLHVTTPTGVNESVLVNVSINASRGIMITIPPAPDIVPGENLTLTVTLNNTGNLFQNFTLIESNSASWTSVLEETEFSLAQGEEVNFTLTIVAPPLDASGGMDDGASHTLTLTAQDVVSAEVVGTASTDLTVAAVFMMEFRDWDDDAYFNRFGSWEYNSEVMNTGNKDVTVELIYSIIRPGGAGVQQAWELDIGAPSTLNLPVGVWVPFNLRISAVDLEPDILLAGELIVEVRPLAADVTGSSVMSSNLHMSRMFSDGEASAFQPLSDGTGTVTQFIEWSHIPLSSEGMGVYEIELCDIQRLINSTPLTDPGFDEWTFALRIGAESYPLDMSPECGTSGAGTEIILPGAVPWVEQSIQVVIGTPVHPYLVADDGWNLTFRLYNSEEHQNHTEYTEATFGFKIINTANPSLSNLRLSSGESVEEDTEVTILVDLFNTGTASAVGVEVTLSCDQGVSVVGDETQQIMLLPPQEEMTLEWDVSLQRLDWWQHSADITCDVSVDALLASGNEVEDDSLEYNSEVVSWAPPSALTVIGFALLLILTGILIRLGGQSEKFLQGAAFTGALTAGLAFHMGALFEGSFSTWFSFGWLMLGAVWILWIAWRSGEEFQLVHEDYQRAKQGQSTIYTDHFAALKDSRRQLTRILSVPVLGTMILILGFPPRLNPDPINIAMLAAYLVIVIGGVWLIIRTAEATYGSIYSKMIEIGARSDRLQEELGDPARLLTELARTGLDLTSVLNEEPNDGVGD